MINDEQQYQTTKEWMRRFEEELWALRALPSTLRHAHPKIRKAQEDSLQKTIDTLRGESHIYETEQAARGRLVGVNEPAGAEAA